MKLSEFQAAYRYRDEQISQAAFLATGEGPIAYSSEETAVFRKWAELQIEDARVEYNKNESMKLARRPQA